MYRYSSFDLQMLPEKPYTSMDQLYILFFYTICTDYELAAMSVFYCYGVGFIFLLIAGALGAQA